MPQTSWIVFTGQPCSGKSTVIRLLEKSDYNVLHEKATEYIEEQAFKGDKEPWSDKKKFQDAILAKQIQAERSLLDQGLKDTLIFFDRGIPDTVTYYEYHDVPKDKRPKVQHDTRYKQIFLFEKGAIKESHDVDGEDPEKLEKLLIAQYERLEYEIIRVPFMSPKKRVEFILEKLGLELFLKDSTPALTAAKPALTPAFAHTTQAVDHPGPLINSPERSRVRC